MFEVEFRVASINHPNWADKSVPFSYQGLKEARFGRVIAQSRSDFCTMLLMFGSVSIKRSERQSFVTMSLRETSCSLRLTMKITSSMGFFSGFTRRPWRRSSLRPMVKRIF